MELEIKPQVSYVSFAHEDYIDIFPICSRYCSCGCGYFQIFGVDEDGNEVRIDILTRDETRHMYE